jgi:hypothetical protein
MHVVPCAPPAGVIEPAPLTSLPLGLGDVLTRVAAFWSEDDQYYVRAEVDGEGPADATDGSRWFCIEAGVVAIGATEAERLAAGRLMADVIPLGGGRIAFPAGSSGRTVYRVWRSRKADKASAGGRTRILGVRAGRSLRRPA